MLRHTTDERGFTLIELLISLVLVSLIGTAIIKALSDSQQLYRAQTERAMMNSNTRMATAILPAEIRELSATDTIGGDITAMSLTGITFKAMRGLFFMCTTPVDGGATGTVVLWGTRSFGVRTDLDGARDSVVIFVEGDSSESSDNYWLHAGVTGTPATGTACPGGAASVTVSLSGVRPIGGLGGVTPGAPLRSFEMIRISAYNDALGDQWLGAQLYSGGAWSAIEPILGPLAASGLQLTYFDAAGAPTTFVDSVARVGLVVIGQTSIPVRGTGGIRRAVDTLTTAVALRNN